MGVKGSEQEGMGIMGGNEVKWECVGVKWTEWERMELLAENGSEWE